MVSRKFRPNPSVAFSAIILTSIFPVSGSAEESKNPVLDPDADPDHDQNFAISELDQV